MSQLSKVEQLRYFLNGGPKSRNFVSLDPSSYASILAGKPGGSPSIEDEMAFHQTFPNDAMVHFFTRLSKTHTRTEMGS